MYVIEIFLPLADNGGRRFPAEQWAQVREALVGRFGGLTAFTLSPAEGLWEAQGERSRDEIVIFEVMADPLDRAWWAGYRADLEKRFRQERLIIRATETEQL